MAAKDIIHDGVRKALEKDHWLITDDPYTLEYEDVIVFVDVAAERVLAAERNGERIAVEIKSFVGRSPIQDVEQALGQYLLYLSFLEEIEPERTLYLAMSDVVYENIFERRAIQFLMQRNQVPLIVVDLEREEIVRWINYPNTAASSDNYSCSMRKP